MGHRQIEQAALFYEFSLERHIPADHLLRSIDGFVDLQEIRRGPAPFYSSIGRPSIDPQLMIRMLLIGYCFGIRSERATRFTSIWPTGGSAGLVTGQQMMIKMKAGRSTSTLAGSRPKPGVRLLHLAATLI